MEKQRAYLPADIRPDPGRERLRLSGPEIGVRPVYNADDHDIFQHAEEQLHQKIQVVIMSKQHHEQLPCVHQDQIRHVHDVHYVVLLVRVEHRPLVAQKVRENDVQKEQNIDRRHIYGRRLRLSKKRQYRDQADACDGNKERYDPKSLSVEGHQRADSVPVAFFQRLVHVEHHCLSDSEIGDAQHRDHVGEQAVQAGVFQSENADEDLLRGQADQHCRHIAQQREQKVSG